MISEERLREAAQEAARALAESLPEPEDCLDLIPPDFEERKKGRLPKPAPRPQWSMLKRVACFFVALCLGSTMLLGTNAKAQELFLGWINEIAGTVSSYTFEGSSVNNPERYQYTLPEIPEGYQEESVYEGNGIHDALYINDRGDYFSFDYLYTTENTATALDILNADEMERKEVVVNGMTADFYFDDTGRNSSALVWNDSETDVLLCLSGYFTEDELIQLAESVIREEK